MPTFPYAPMKILRRPVIKSQIFETPGIVITNTGMFAIASK